MHPQGLGFSVSTLWEHTAYKCVPQWGASVLFLQSFLKICCFCAQQQQQIQTEPGCLLSVIHIYNCPDHVDRDMTEPQ